MQEIPQDFLYPVLKDAVKVARRLGLRYLWIDSLCIIQDDLSDWHRQSSAMASIYENACITISGLSCAGDTSDSLFAQAPAGYNFAEFAHVDGNSVFIRATKSDSHPILFDPNSRYYRLMYSETFPLLRRGWAYQERLLSKRIIYFTKHELIWECMTDFWCECSPVREERVNEFRPIETYFMPALKKNVEWLSWDEIVTTYSQMDLSFEKDRLPALSGVARRYGEINERTYIAGLWKEDLLDQLLWRQEFMGRTVPGESITRKSSRKLPTWPWISVRGRIGWDGVLDNVQYSTKQDLARIVSEDIVYSANDKYIDPEHARLTVEGPAFPARILYGDSWFKARSIQESDIFFGLVYEKVSFSFLPDCYIPTAPKQHDLGQQEEVFCLVCESHSTQNFHNLPDRIAKGLVLRAVDASKGWYERIGYFGETIFGGFCLDTEDAKKLWTVRQLTII
jgi:hypothetical protein